MALKTKTFIFFADIPPYPDKEQFTLYKNCGFNTYLFTEDHIAYQNDKELYKDKIRLAKSLGLDVWIRGYNDNTNNPTYFDKFEDFDLHEFDNITGIYFVDEPVVAHLDSFESICVPFFNEKYSDLFWHINLLPSYTHSGSLCPNNVTDIPPFEYYINKYASIVDKVNGNKDISIDHYPLFSKNGKDYVSDTWLYDMTIVSNKAKSIGAKITNCVQAFSDPGWRTLSCQNEMDF